MKAFFAGLGTASILAIAGFFLVTVGFPIFFGKGPSEVSVPATVAPEVKKMPTRRVAVKGPGIKVIEDKAKEKLKLPDEVVKNEDQHVIAATQVKGSDRPQTVTTVIDEKTGESRSFVKFDPYPWLALENRGEVRMSFGYRYSLHEKQMQRVGRLSFTYDAIRVKALVAGPTAHIDTDGQSYFGLGVAYRW